MQVAGVDEAGRGCLAGPVYAAAVILRQPVAGLRDSKQLSASRREQLAIEIRAASVWALGRASPREIEKLNILQASLLAMRRAVLSLSVVPDLAQVDGNHCPALPCPCEAIIGGDALIPAVMAASILAKTARDQCMRRLDHRYPGYGFARHKGYPTAAHIVAMRRLGVSPVHRRTYKPVRALLE